MSSLETIRTHRVDGGTLRYLKHDSATTGRAARA